MYLVTYYAVNRAHFERLLLMLLDMIAVKDSIHKLSHSSWMFESIISRVQSLANNGPDRARLLAESVASSGRYVQLGRRFINGLEVVFASRSEPAVVPLRRFSTPQGMHVTCWIASPSVMRFCVSICSRKKSSNASAEPFRATISPHHMPLSTTSLY
jgi:hypothetical protein